MSAVLPEQDAVSVRPSAEGPRTRPSKGGDPIVSLLDAAWTQRKLVAGITIGVAVLSAIVSLIVPKSWTARVTVLPEVDRGAGGMMNLAQLASSLGFNLGTQAMPTEVLPIIMHSDRVFRVVAYRKYPRQDLSRDPVSLIELWRMDTEDSAVTYEDARRKFRRSATEIHADRRSGVIALSVELHDPRIAAAVANDVVKEMDQYVREFRRTTASEQRLWIEGRLNEVGDSLRQSEDALASFLLRNRVLDDPAVRLQHERLERDVQLNTTLYTELKRQYELVRIEEVKNTPIVNVIDPAEPPARRSWPKRKIFVIIATMLGFGMALLIAWGKDVYQREGDRLPAARLFHRVRDDLRRFRRRS